MAPDGPTHGPVQPPDLSADLSQVFHRLNNQLGVILANAELLESRLVDDAQRALKAGDGLLHAVGLLALKARVGGIDLAALLEIRPLVPIGPGNDVHLAIVVEITDGGAFGPELVGGANFLEAVEELGGACERRRDGDKNCGQKNSNHGAMLGSRTAAGQAA